MHKHVTETLMRFGFILYATLILPFAAFAEEAAVQSAPSALPTIDCHYQFAKDLTTIDPSVVEIWSKHAAIQLFTLNNSELKQQLDELKLCFTDQGWQGFNTAFEKSGNLEAIKTRQLSVFASQQGHVTMEVNKDNQWKVAIPLHVTYQNKDNKIEQTLMVNLLITRKPSGSLGILQVIATPQKSQSAPKTQ